MSYNKFKSTVALVVLLSSFAPLVVQAKEKDGDVKAAFEKGSKTLGISLGFGTGYDFYDGYGYGIGLGLGSSDFSRMPSFAVNYDHGIANAGPGTIGVGGIMSLQRSTYKYGGGDKDFLTNYVIGVRGTYHLTLLKKKNNKFDPYGGVTLAMRIFRYSDNYSDYTDGEMYPMAGLFVGAKYNFSTNFGLFSELGYDIALFRFGMNVNF